MGFPLSPAIANIYMEEFEQNEINTAILKPKCWFRYVDDTFVIWPHGSHTLDDFLQHLNNIHSNIKFTMETENNNELPFLDTLIKKHVDGKLILHYIENQHIPINT
ncbi:hypothetical protein RI129_001500 [Pyrocoelia pectoralis]|uniref:Reverse transcriptase domain-containing protein n=1 Tax=Pyrocoelia pectoralis TaxID=417401 RepID=A0AAN7VTX9_9COLE